MNNYPIKNPIKKFQFQLNKNLKNKNFHKKQLKIQQVRKK